MNKELNIFSLTYGQIAKINDSKVWELAKKHTHPECYSCPCFYTCKPGYWFGCELLLNNEYEEGIG